MNRNISFGLVVLVFAASLFGIPGNNRDANGRRMNEHVPQLVPVIPQIISLKKFRRVQLVLLFIIVQAMQKELNLSFALPN